MSFGSSCTVDNHIKTSPFPTLSMVTGLLANALGYDLRDFDRLEALQRDIRFAARRDYGGEAHTDYQIMHLGQEFLQDRYAWTTWGFLQRRGGAKEYHKEPHQRWKDYLVNSCFTLALTAPNLAPLREALRSPSRPLYLGRKCCPPSHPILVGMVEGASSLREAVISAPRRDFLATGSLPKIWWPEGDSTPSGHARKIQVTDRRDWRNGIHVGLRHVFEEILDV